MASRAPDSISAVDTLWVLSSFCNIYQRSFDPALLARECVPPLALRDLPRIAEHLGLDAATREIRLEQVRSARSPIAVQLWRAVEPRAAAPDGAASVGENPAASGADGLAASPLMEEAHGADPAARVEWMIVLRIEGDTALVAAAGDSAPRTVPLADVASRLTNRALYVAPRVAPVSDSDVANRSDRQFGFGWFVPELLKHKHLWREVLLASLVLQLMALAFPLFTQTIIDKVVVHRTESTLIALAIGMAVFVVFTAALSWVRQYLVLHTGNRVDAVLGSQVFEHLFKLPLLYFQHRPTGVIAARMQGVETIREFVSSAAVTLLLDLPFLLVFVAVMFWYSVTLTLLVLAILGLIVVASLLVAPLFQKRLNEQFMRGAANQAFLTEYVAGLETVKSLQLEPQLNRRYRDLLAAFLGASFRARQLGNSYGTLANGLEQLMSLLILAIGAWLVMTASSFTVGMLVAFQMFASRLSQPMLRLVGLWQQFQQARLAVQRLGDIMNVPTEPYRLSARALPGKGVIEIADLAFRYADNLPLLFDGFGLEVKPGQLVAVMGPSGAGKSTLAKLLQGFYLPTRGAIRIDGVDLRYLSANELRGYFGVVPQETTLFSGTILDNVRIANPFASFEQVVAACRMAEIHAAIEALPNGYHTEIGERGAGLSGGQRQRLAIARALLKGPRVLIFDEATSSLDPPTAEQVGRTISALKGRVTILFIAHALPRTLQIDSVVKIGEKLSVVPPVEKRVDAAASPGSAEPEVQVS
jgi:subfamily B ATP-binding cassette protein HlyB/CyaB